MALSQINLKRDVNHINKTLMAKKIIVAVPVMNFNFSREYLL